MNASSQQKPQIYYHAGLGKVASTYLQKSVFPALDGICYIHRNRFRRHARIIGAGQCGRYLISRECGKYLDRRLKEIAGYYPDARVLLFFRRHDEWIASHYRRYVKNGGSRALPGYLDMEKDRGIWKREQLVYMDMIDRVERYFGAKPFVLTYDRLRRDGADFNRRLAEHLGATIDPARLRSAPVHQSYSDERLNRVRVINRALGLKDPESPATADGFGVTRLSRRLKLYRSYLILLAASLVPKRAVAGETLIDEESLAAIRAHYADDWRAVEEFERSQFGE